MHTIDINGTIGNGPGEINAKSIRQQLPTDGSDIEVRIHSEGGSVFETFALLDLFKGYRGRKTAVVESMAFSAASLLLCAFDDVSITETGYTMLHSPHLDDSELNDSDRRLLAQLNQKMVNIYCQKTRQPRSRIEKLLAEEWFFDAEASISLGIVDRIARVPAGAMARSRRVVFAKLKPASNTAAARWKSAVDSEYITGKSRTEAIIAVDRDHPGLRAEYLAEVNRR